MTGKDVKKVIKKYSIRAHLVLFFYLLMILGINQIYNVSLPLSTIFILMGLQILLMLVVNFVQKVLIEVFELRKEE